MAPLRKTLGRRDSPWIVSLKALMDTVDKPTIACWCLQEAEQHMLPIFEKRCPGDDRPRLALLACRDWFQGTAKLPYVKDIILNGCHAAARQLDHDPAAQAAARACGQAASCCHVAAHALGLSFYGTAAIAYDTLGTHQSAEVYNQLAARETARMEADLRMIAAEAGQDNRKSENP